MREPMAAAEGASGGSETDSTVPAGAATPTPMPGAGARPLTTRHEGVVAWGAWTGEASRYEIAGEIARGGGGRVMAARDLRLGREVAVKLPLDEPGSLPRLMREAQLMAQLEHPSIVSVHDLARDGDGTP